METHDPHLELHRLGREIKQKLSDLEVLVWSYLDTLYTHVHEEMVESEDEPEAEPEIELEREARE